MIKIILGAIAGAVFVYLIAAFVLWQLPVDFEVMSQYERGKFAACCIVMALLGGLTGNLFND